MYCLDALFVSDASKLIAGNLTALAAMVHLELPHINVLTKCDLVDKEELDRYLAPSGEALAGELTRAMGARYKSLNHAMARLVRTHAHSMLEIHRIYSSVSLRIIYFHVSMHSLSRVARRL